jgi:hypothetical protein
MRRLSRRLTILTRPSHEGLSCMDTNSSEGTFWEHPLLSA